MEETVEPASLLGLPYELQQKIASGLDIESTLNLCIGAKALDARICKDENFWREKYQRDLGPEKLYGSLGWFENYRIKANGVMDFEYDSDASDIYVKLGNRIIGTLPHIDPEVPRTGVLSLFLKGSGPLEALDRIEGGLKVRLNYQVTLETNKDSEMGGRFVITTICPDSGVDLSHLYLTRRETLRLIVMLYNDYYIAFYM